MSRLTTKRIYQPPAAEDGVRVLVDRLWPRGLSKDKAHIDHWLKAVAPSSPLRIWYGHDITKWTEFKRRYFKELEQQEEQLSFLRELVAGGTVTLLYSTRNESHNNAVALAEYLETAPAPRRDPPTPG